MTLGRGKNQQEHAEAIGIDALSFLAAEPERLERFMALAGIDISTIREVAQDSAFLAAVLDHLMSDEPLLLAFAANKGVKPDVVVRAAHALGGGPWERDSA
jgi:thiamine monophosphate synthase